MSVWSPERQDRRFELHFAPVWYRGIGNRDARWPLGFEIGFGSRSVARVRPFLLSWSSEPAFRALDSKSFALSILQRVFAGVELGPIEPEVGGGVSMLTLDVFHANYSIEMASPRAEAGAWLHIGALRLGAHAYGELLWRWFGDRDYLLRGVAFEVGIAPSTPEGRQ